MWQGAWAKKWENKGDEKLGLDVGLNLCLFLGALLNNQHCGAKVENIEINLLARRISQSARYIIASQMVALPEIYFVQKEWIDLIIANGISSACVEAIRNKAQWITGPWMGARVWPEMCDVALCEV